jgi:hypothetical protein
MSSQVHQEVTFKPKTNRLNKEMEKKVEDLRKNYSLVKEHSKSPIKEKNKEKARTDSIVARQKVQDFLERNNHAQKQKDIHLKKLKEEFDEVFQESIQPISYNSNKVSSTLLHESTKYKDMNLWERQKAFIEAREKKLENLKKEKLEEEAHDNFIFHKETNKKYLNSSKTRGVDQSAKTDQVNRQYSASPSPTFSDMKDRTVNRMAPQAEAGSRDVSPDIEKDYSRVFLNLDENGINTILFKLKAEDDIEENDHPMDNQFLPRPRDSTPT